MLVCESIALVILGRDRRGPAGALPEQADRFVPVPGQLHMPICIRTRGGVWRNKRSQGRPAGEAREIEPPARQPASVPWRLPTCDGTARPTPLDEWRTAGSVLPAGSRRTEDLSQVCAPADTVCDRVAALRVLLNRPHARVMTEGPA